MAILQRPNPAPQLDGTLLLGNHDGDVLLRANRQETFDLSASLVPLWALAWAPKV
jgi:hypothetical protein